MSGLIKKDQGKGSVVPAKAMSMEDEEDHLIAKLRPIELRYVGFAAGDYTVSQLARMLSCSTNRVRTMKKNPNVRRLVEIRKIKLYKATERTQIQRRRNMIDMAEANFMESFRDFSEEEIEDMDDMDKNERMMRLQTRASNADFSKRAKVLMDLLKFDHDVSPKVQEETHSFVQTVRTQHRSRQEEDEQSKKELSELGITEDDMFSFASLDADGNLIESTPEEVLARLGDGEIRQQVMQMIHTTRTTRAGEVRDEFEEFGEEDEDQSSFEVIDIGK